MFECQIFENFASEASGYEGYITLSIALWEATGLESEVGSFARGDWWTNFSFKA